MTRIYIASLNREVREKICRQVYSTEELHQIKVLLERSLDQKKEGFSRAVLITMLIAIVLLVTSVLQAGTTPGDRRCGPGDRRDHRHNAAVYLVCRDRTAERTVQPCAEKGIPTVLGRAPSVNRIQFCKDSCRIRLSFL